MGEAFRLQLWFYSELMPIYLGATIEYPTLLGKPAIDLAVTRVTEQPVKFLVCETINIRNEQMTNIKSKKLDLDCDWCREFYDDSENPNPDTAGFWIAEMVYPNMPEPHCYGNTLRSFSGECVLTLIQRLEGKVGKAFEEEIQMIWNEPQNE